MYLTQGLHRAIQQMPTRTATAFGDRSRTWAEVADRVARLAGGLQEVGVRTDDRVAYLGWNSDWFNEFYLAVPWANAAVNPVNIRWTADEIAYSLRDSETRVLIVDDGFTEIVREVQKRYDGLRTVLHASDDRAAAGMISLEELIRDSRPLQDCRRGGDALAGLFYTGGTTGFPKGVMLSHANLVTSALGSAAMGFIAPGATFLHAAPMFHLADLAAWMIVSLTGGSHVMVPGFEPQSVCEAIERHGVTDTVMIPTMLQILIDSEHVTRCDVSTLRNIGYGGSPITEAVLARARERLPGVSFSQAFGQTELSPITTLLTQADHNAGTRLRSAGRAAFHAEVRVVDEDDNACPPGQVGEIVARGGHVMLGYWRLPEETGLALRGGWLHTGDGGYLDDDGYLYVVDRLKDMIISGGENIYSAEVENAIAQHQGVAACAVIAVPDERLGERVHAVVVLHAGATATEEGIREHAKSLVAGYKAPRSVEFVDALPLSSTGKVLKRELRKKHWAGVDREVS